MLKDKNHYFKILRQKIKQYEEKTDQIYKVFWGKNESTACKIRNKAKMSTFTIST